MSWYDKAVRAGNRIDSSHISPWKSATAYALLSIAESLQQRLPQQHDSQGEAAGEVLTVADVARMTALVPSTLRYWHWAGKGEGPKAFKLGRRIMYRRTDVEQWIEDAHARA
jgi:predicted DNA-binding transcriptional regulator AlpA